MPKSKTATTGRIINTVTCGLIVFFARREKVLISIAKSVDLVPHKILTTVALLDKYDRILPAQLFQDV
eukprot:11558924-Karenia_brevis.AAC.1